MRRPALIAPWGAGVARVGVGEAAGVGEEAMGVEVEVVRVDEVAMTTAAAACPACSARPAGPSAAAEDSRSFAGL